MYFLSPFLPQILAIYLDVVTPVISVEKYWVIHKSRRDLRITLYVLWNSSLLRYRHSVLSAVQLCSPLHLIHTFTHSQ